MSKFIFVGRNTFFKKNKRKREYTKDATQIHSGSQGYPKYKS